MHGVRWWQQGWGTKVDNPLAGLQQQARQRFVRRRWNIDSARCAPRTQADTGRKEKKAYVTRPANSANFDEPSCDSGRHSWDGFSESTVRVKLVWRSIIDGPLGLMTDNSALKLFLSYMTQEAESFAIHRFNSSSPLGKFPFIRADDKQRANKINARTRHKPIPRSHINRHGDAISPRVISPAV